MRIILIAIFLFFLTSFQEYGTKSDEFSISINYFAFPGRPNFEYKLVNTQLTLKKIYWVKKKNPYSIDWIEKVKEHRYKIVLPDELKKIIENTDWKTFKKPLEAYCTQESVYQVQIVKNQDTFSYNVFPCANDTLLDQMVRLCNKCIPNKKVRKDFNIFTK